MFNIRNASLPAIIVSKTDTEMSQAIVLEGCHRISTLLDIDCISSGYDNYRIDVIMSVVEDEEFSSAWPHCLSLEFSESFTSESSVSSRVELSLMPSLILDIGMKIHSNEERRTKGTFSIHDSAFFTYKYLEKKLSDAELTKLRSHPHERGVFWIKLEKQGLVLASGNSQIPMLPLFILLMMPKSQKEIARLNDTLQKIGNKDRIVGNVDKEKSDASEFVVHDKIDDIEDSSICFFYQTIPTDDVQQMISKKLNIVVAEPPGETLDKLGKWPASQKTLAIVNNLIYNGHGQQHPCLLAGERLLQPGSRHLAPVSSRKLLNFVSKWFPGQNDGKIHTVRGFFTVPK